MYIWWSRLRWSILLYLDWFGTNCVMAKSSHAMRLWYTAGEDWSIKKYRVLPHRKAMLVLLSQQFSSQARYFGCDVGQVRHEMEPVCTCQWSSMNHQLSMKLLLTNVGICTDVAARRASGASTASIRTTCLGTVGRWTRWRQRPSDTFSMFVHSASFTWNNKDQKGSKKHGWQATKHLLLTQL